MPNRLPDDAARALLAASLQALGVRVDEERLATLTPLAADLLADGEALSGRAAPEVEPMVVLRLPGADREGER